MPLQIHPVLCRAGTMDNYSYIIVDEETLTSAVIDPSEAAPIITKLSQLNLCPQYILNTHHHFDHTDENLTIKEKYGAKIIGNQNDRNRIPGFDIGVLPDTTFSIGQSEAQIIDASAHTQGHILWYFPSSQALFTGDTLFNLCIGGLFEGTPHQMYNVLAKIKQLPDNTLFYPGHEYTLYGLGHLYGPAAEIYAAKAKERLKKGLSVAPITLGEEKVVNPYLACRDLNEFYQLMGS